MRETTLYDFRVGARTHNSEFLGNIQLAGSGANHFIEILQNIDCSSVSMQGNPTDFVTSVGKLLLIACDILGEEMNTFSNLGHFYGGGFELVYFNQGKFEKVDNITYIFWDVILISPDAFKIAARVALKFVYFKDALRIHRFDFRINDEAESQSDSRALFVVAPIHRNLAVTEIEEIKETSLPDLNSGFFCHYFAIHRPNGKAENLVLLDKDQPNTVKFTNDNNKIVLSVHRNFGERLLNSIRSRTHV